MNSNMNLVGEEEHLHHNEQKQHNLPVCKTCNAAIDLRELMMSKEELGDLIEEKVKKFVDPILKALNLLLPSSSLPKQAEPSVSRSFRLCFKGHMPDAIFTRVNIENQGASLELELCDNTGKRLEQVDPDMKDLKVMFSALDGFKNYDSDNFTVEDFNTHVAIRREDKPALLKSFKSNTCEVSLTNGIARVCGIFFTDNSSSRVSGKFRLGARVMTGLPSGSVVWPAVSKAFKVKEKRPEGEQKHQTPLPQDKISRLSNISKIKAAKGATKKIYKVLDFLQLYNTDEGTLQQILELQGNQWTETVKQAQDCNLNNLDKYKYLDDKSGDILLLKPDFGIESVTFKGQNDQPYDSLNESQKKKVHELRKTAFEKRMELEKVDASSNQTPVQDGLECSYNIERQEQPAAPILTACINPSANMYLSTTVTDHDTSQQLVMSTSGCLTNGEYGGNYTNMVIGNMTQQGATNGFDLQSFSNFTGFTEANQDTFQQHPMSASGCLTNGAYGGNYTNMAFESSMTQQGATNGFALHSFPNFTDNTSANQDAFQQDDMSAILAQINEPNGYVDDILKENCSDSGIIQQEHHQMHQQKQIAMAAPNAVAENLNASSQMCSIIPPSNPLPTSKEDRLAGITFEGSSENGGLLCMNKDPLVDTPPQERWSNVSASDSGFRKLRKKFWCVIKVSRRLRWLRNSRCGNGEIPIPNIQGREESVAVVRFSVQQDLTPPAKKPKLC